MTTAFTQIEWDNTSQFNDFQVEQMYSRDIEVTVYDFDYTLSFHMDGRNLIIKVVSLWETAYYDLGEFFGGNADAIECVKKFADYVVFGFLKYGNLIHCPGFNRVEDVDDNYNPI